MTALITKIKTWKCQHLGHAVARRMIFTTTTGTCPDCGLTVSVADDLTF